ncbi:phosphatase PAP2 family protein [Paenibacillus senegalensis]|uniref:phosphatase PAP2 family protein n=1 Tax=Paenibacillus senegalensis TaxID=1465766 RepID=UPI0002896FD1|nr:phosphatase PAP2 family protein [Paenibacillus senegalensis]
MQGWKRLDHNLFVWCNQRISHAVLDQLLGIITHMGGAIFTIVSALLVAWLAPEEWSTIGIQSLFALTVSHIIAVIIKRKVQRIRPFRILQQVRVGKFPLKDYSFPSGHTTAIFALVTPFLFIVSPAISLLLLLLAVLVGLSRVYWGYHYPTDCVVGGAIGFITALLVVFFTT